MIYIYNLFYTLKNVTVVLINSNNKLSKYSVTYMNIDNNF